MPSAGCSCSHRAVALVGALLAVAGLAAAQAPIVDIATQPGCFRPNIKILPQGLTDCQLTGFISSNNTHRFTFQLDANVSYSVQFVLRTIQGEATMSLYAPGDSMSPGRMEPLIMGQNIYITATAMESLLVAQPSQLKGKGTYTLTLQAMKPMLSPFFSITVLTPPANVRMAASQAGALADIHQACCPARNDYDDPAVINNICKRG